MPTRSRVATTPATRSVVLHSRFYLSVLSANMPAAASGLALSHFINRRHQFDLSVVKETDDTFDTITLINFKREHAENSGFIEEESS